MLYENCFFMSIKCKYNYYIQNNDIKIEFNSDRYSNTQSHAYRAITQFPIDNPNDPRDPRVEKQLLDYDARGNLTHIEREINNPELPMDDSRESVQKLVWDEEDRLLGVDLRPESSRGQPHSPLIRTMLVEHEVFVMCQDSRKACLVALLRAMRRIWTLCYILTHLLPCVHRNYQRILKLEKCIQVLLLPLIPSTII